MNYIQESINEISAADQDYRCVCGTYVDKGKNHNKINCLYLEGQRIASNMYCSAVMTSSGQDMSYHHNELERNKEAARKSHLPEMQRECFKRLEKSKQILLRDDLFTDFIEKYPNYAKLFDMKTKEEIPFMDAVDMGQGTFMSNMTKFLKSDLVQEKKRKRAKEQQILFQKAQKQKQELMEKRNAENLKKEYECMKLYNHIESSNMNSYELYQEYTKIKSIRDRFPSTQSMFLDYFTASKIAEIKKELNKNGVKEQPICTVERIDDLEDNIIHHITAFSK